jgi:hypothetical protein
VTGATRRGAAGGYLAFGLLLGLPFLAGFVAGCVVGNLP